MEGRGTKAIPEARDRLQSRVLVWVVGLMLAVPSVICGLLATHPKNSGLSCLYGIEVSLTFGAVVWALRAATPMAALSGAMVCVAITVGTGNQRNLLASGLSPLMTLFMLTFIATRMGRVRKTWARSTEQRRGRSAAQVIANLGVAGLLADLSSVHGSLAFSHALPALLTAALCEATADTVSSEIGSAFGGRPVMLTTFRSAEPGTDGAVSVLGTLAGIAAAAIVAGVGMWAMPMNLLQSAIGFAGGVAGLFFDSLLGATVERKGWLGNDLVNFSSTLFAVLVALGLLMVLR